MFSFFFSLWVFIFSCCAFLASKNIWWLEINLCFMCQKSRVMWCGWMLMDWLMVAMLRWMISLWTQWTLHHCLKCNCLHDSVVMARKRQCVYFPFKEYSRFRPSVIYCEYLKISIYSVPLHLQHTFISCSISTGAFTSFQMFLSMFSPQHSVIKMHLVIKSLKNIQQ